MKLGFDQIMVEGIVKPELRPDSSQEYYEAWSRPDSGISLTQVVKPGFDRITAQQVIVKPGL